MEASELAEGLEDWGMIVSASSFLPSCSLPGTSNRGACVKSYAGTGRPVMLYFRNLLEYYVDS